MIQESLEVFEKIFEKEGIDLVLDNYVPKNGTYIFVDLDTGEIKDTIKIQKNNEESNDYNLDEKNFFINNLKKLDYYCDLLDMNKPIDAKKVIHSNQIYGIFVKKNVIKSKLTEKIISDFTNRIKNPLLKYKNKKAKELYLSIEKELNELDINDVEFIYNWLLNNIYTLDDNEKVNLDYNEKDYLKIFFINYDDMEKTFSKFENEYKRYVLPNIFNSNDYNEICNGEVYGTSNYCYGLNAKKPYLQNKSRKKRAAYYISINEALLQKNFYDYLLENAKNKKYLVYFSDYDIKAINYKDIDQIPEKDYKYLLRIAYSKNIEIKGFDIISKNKSDRNLNFINYFEINYDKFDKESTVQYGNYGDSKIIQLIDSILFGKKLIYSYYNNDNELDIKEGEIKRLIVKYRDSLYRFIYLNDDSYLIKIIHDLYIDSVKISFKLGNEFRAKEKFNLGLSLEKDFGGVDNMAIINEAKNSYTNHYHSNDDWIFASDDEYYYGIGQILAYINRLRNTKDKNLSFINNICSSKDNKIIKKRVFNYINKYGFNININNYKLDQLIHNILIYEPQEEVNSMIIMAGFLGNLEILNKKEDK